MVEVILVIMDIVAAVCNLMVMMVVLDEWRL